MLGVGVFFTLSGYLITDLLLGHWRRHGRLGLGTFWLRRARRLLPALFLVLATVSVWVALFDASQLDQVRRQVISSGVLLRELVDDRAARVVLRAVRDPAAARPHVVAGDRGAVLPRVAVAAAAGIRGGEPAGPGVDDARPGRASVIVMGLDLPPRLRPDARLRGHRHPRVRAADRRSARGRLAEPAANRARRPRLPNLSTARGRSGSSRSGCWSGGPTRSRFPVPVRVPDPLGRDRGGRGGGRPPREPGRHGARHQAAALDRRPLVRDLPVAVADHRPRSPGETPGWVRGTLEVAATVTIAVCRGATSRSRSATEQSAGGGASCGRGPGGWASSPTRWRCLVRY